MSVKIAFPNKDYFKILIENFREIEKHYDLELVYCKDDEIEEMIREGKADLAMLNPFAYGNLLQFDEFRLLPTTCISAVSFTNLEKIYFSENLKGISTFALDVEDSYIALVVRLILLEKYNFETQSAIFKGNLKDALNKFDAFVTTESSKDNLQPLDLTEEWFDTFEYELPLGVWVIRNDGDAELLAEITKKLAQANLPSSVPVHEDVQKANTNYQREGEIKYHFNIQTETAIDDILELLYQLGYLDDITDSKISLS